MGEIIQLPLPETDHIPAWVKAALDTIVVDGRRYNGLTIIPVLEELKAVSPMRKQIEQTTLATLKELALVWQSANFKLTLTGYELDVLEAEKDALQHPYSTTRKSVTEYYRDSNGELLSRKVETVAHDRKWITEYIQRRLGSHGLIMDYHQIRSILEQVSSVYKICDYLGVQPKIVQSRRVLRAA